MMIAMNSHSNHGLKGQKQSTQGNALRQNACGQVTPRRGKSNYDPKRSMLMPFQGETPLRILYLRALPYALGLLPLQGAHR